MSANVRLGQIQILQFETDSKPHNKALLKTCNRMCFELHLSFTLATLMSIFYEKLPHYKSNTKNASTGQLKLISLTRQASLTPYNTTKFMFRMKCLNRIWNHANQTTSTPPHRKQTCLEIDGLHGKERKLFKHIMKIKLTCWEENKIFFISLQSLHSFLWTFRLCNKD